MEKIYSSNLKVYTFDNFLSNFEFAEKDSNVGHLLEKSITKTKRFKQELEKLSALDKFTSSALLVFEDILEKEKSFKFDENEMSGLVSLVKEWHSDIIKDRFSCFSGPLISKIKQMFRFGDLSPTNSLLLHELKTADPSPLQTETDDNTSEQDNENNNLNTSMDDNSNDPGFLLLMEKIEAIDKELKKTNKELTKTNKELTKTNKELNKVKDKNTHLEKSNNAIISKYEKMLISHSKMKDQYDNEFIIINDKLNKIQSRDVIEKIKSNLLAAIQIKLKDGKFNPFRNNQGHKVFYKQHELVSVYMDLCFVKQPWNKLAHSEGDLEKLITYLNLITNEVKASTKQYCFFNFRNVSSFVETYKKIYEGNDANVINELALNSIDLNEIQIQKEQQTNKKSKNEQKVKK